MAVQGIPLMMKYVHYLLQSITRWHGNAAPQLDWILDLAPRVSGKTLIVLALEHDYDVWPIYASALYSGFWIPYQMENSGQQGRPRTEILVEIDTAALINFVILRSEQLGTAPEEWQRLRKRIYPKKNCHREVVLVRVLEAPTAITSYFEPTKGQSAAILEEIDDLFLFGEVKPEMAPWRYYYDSSRQRARLTRFHELARDVVSSKHSVLDCGHFLLQKGHFIPTQEDIDPLLHGNTIEDRALALSALDQKAQKWWNEYEKRE